MRSDEAVEQLYSQLRRAAELAMQQERPDHTLSATALVNEAYLRLKGSFANAAHFYASAADAMRRVLIDHARARLADKRGGGAKVESHTALLDAADLRNTLSADPAEILALDEALLRLEAQDAQAAAVVRHRFFAGLSIDQTAAALGLSPRTVKRDWQYARAFLHRELGASASS